MTHTIPTDELTFKWNHKVKPSLCEIWWNPVTGSRLLKQGNWEETREQFELWQEQETIELDLCD